MVAAVSMVRDEQDIVESTLLRMAGQVDFLIVADNRSTDGTRDILDDLARELPLTVIADPEPGYYQAEKMTALVERAAAAGAEWVIPFDADEVWRAKDGLIRDVLPALPAGVLVAEAPLFDHVATGLDPDHPDPITRLGWRRSAPAPLRKVAVRYREGVEIAQGNHSAMFPGEPLPMAVTNALEVRHFPLRSVEQMIRKARNGAEAYAATDLPAAVGSHWRSWGTLEGDQLAEVFHRFYWRERPDEPLTIGTEQQPALVYDPVG